MLDQSIKKPDGKLAMRSERSYPVDTSIISHTLKQFSKRRADAVGFELFAANNSKVPQIFLASDNLM